MLLGLIGLLIMCKNNTWCLRMFALAAAKSAALFAKGRASVGPRGLHLVCALVSLQAGRSHSLPRASLLAEPRFSQEHRSQTSAPQGRHLAREDVGTLWGRLAHTVGGGRLRDRSRLQKCLLGLEIHKQKAHGSAMARKMSLLWHAFALALQAAFDEDERGLWIDTSSLSKQECLPKSSEACFAKADQFMLGLVAYAFFCEERHYMFVAMCDTPKPRLQPLTIPAAIVHTDAEATSVHEQQPTGSPR